MSELLNHTVTYKLVRNFTLGLLLIGTLSILINILNAQTAYTLATLKQEVKNITLTLEQAETEQLQLTNLDNLHQKAQALGMQPADITTTHILTID